MGIKNLNVVLDNIPPNGYPPGATLTGRVIISANKPDHIRSLTLKVHGEADVSFTDFVTRRRRRFRRFRTRGAVGNDFGTMSPGHHGTMSPWHHGTMSSSACEIEDTTSRELERFTAQEQYFTTSYQILGETEIQAGEQEYLFTTVLPPRLPSTFIGRFGYIRYTLKIKLDKAWNFDQVAKVEFRVAAPKDLNSEICAIASNNTMLTLADPVIYRGMKHFNCLCCKSGPFSMVVQLSKSGLVPGEPLQLTIELDNTTKVNITSVNIILRQTTFWTSRFPRSNTKRTDEALLVMHCQGVSPRNSRSWYQAFTIPAIPYINIDTCTIIKLQHSITVEAVPEGMHSNLVVEAPIVIGTVPTGGGMRMPDPTAPPDIGFLQAQPSAPTDYDFVQPEPPPPYPYQTSTQTYPPDKPLQKY